MVLLRRFTPLHTSLSLRHLAVDHLPPPLHPLQDILPGFCLPCSSSRSIVSDPRHAGQVCYGEAVLGLRRSIFPHTV